MIHINDVLLWDSNETKSGLDKETNKVIKYIEYDGTGSYNGKIIIEPLLHIDESIGENYRILRITDEYFTAIENINKEEIYLAEDMYSFEEPIQEITDKATDKIAQALNYGFYSADNYQYDDKKTIRRIKKMDETTLDL